MPPCGHRHFSQLGAVGPNPLARSVSVYRCIGCGCDSALPRTKRSAPWQDCRADVVITADATMRGPKPIPLKGVADKAIELAAKNGHTVKKAKRCVPVAAGA